MDYGSSIKLFIIKEETKRVRFGATLVHLYDLSILAIEIGEVNPRVFRVRTTVFPTPHEAPAVRMLLDFPAANWILFSGSFGSFFFGGFVSVADMKNDAETIFTTKSAPRRSLLPRPPRGFGDAEIRTLVGASGVPPAHCEHSKLIDGHGIGDWAMGKLQRWA